MFSIVAIAAIGAVLLLNTGAAQKSASNVDGNIQNATTTATGHMAATTDTPTVAASTWQKLIPAIRKILDQDPHLFASNGIRVESRSPLEVFGETTSSDNVSEALVGLGDGGASNEGVVVMRLEKSDPMLTYYEDRDGVKHIALAMYGATAIYGEALTLLPQDNAIMIGSWGKTIDDSGNIVKMNCETPAYRWNSSQQLFTFNQALTEQYHDRFCEVAKTWPGYGVFDLSPATTSQQ